MVGGRALFALHFQVTIRHWGKPMAGRESWRNRCNGLFSSLLTGSYLGTFLTLHESTYLSQGEGTEASEVWHWDLQFFCWLRSVCSLEEWHLCILELSHDSVVLCISSMTVLLIVAWALLYQSGQTTEMPIGQFDLGDSPDEALLSNFCRLCSC